MTNDIERCCKNCDFYSRFNDSTGSCRRHPPQRQYKDARKWPLVRASEWCGEFDARDDVSAMPWQR